MRAMAFVIPVVFAISPLLTDRLQPNRYEGGRGRDVGASAQRNTSSLAQMLGTFRTAASDIMFIKTERYLHSGIAYEPHLDGESLSAAGIIEEIDEAHVHASSRTNLVVEKDSAGKAPTIIPDAAHDWRGYVGSFERAVKPWRSQELDHTLTDGRELLPWFRVMTLTDPHYIRGYAIGGWWLQRRNLDAAIAFVQEGITNNPESFEILYTLGQLQMERGRKANNDSILNPNEASLPAFRTARDTFLKAAELAVALRPAGWKENEKNDQSGWTSYKDDDARGAARMAVLSEKNYGDPQKARAMAKKYLEKFAPDETLRHSAED